ncbi:hypothetical protein SLEP1_g6471 [Rubroshorea leprosula]|uniref:Flowering locus C n=2 Tax=Rubroshorea TaxID=3068352 RepID=A0AAV5I3F5_9ROSI|nr:flowering locus C [Rubroshorea beccariana]GKU92794.1 hypothetical protein SLEP1_g6471 [Rubroshorea leprosula]
MGRRKLQMKRIEDKSSRQVTFSKRRSGLIKKARELSILCDVDTAVIIFSSHGKLFEFSSTNSLGNMLERYRSHYEEKYETSKDVKPALISHAELLNMIQSQLEEQKVEQLTLTDLVKLEKQLTMSLSETRARKTELMMEYIMSLREKKRLLGEEYKLLQKEVAAMEISNTDGNMVGVDPPLELTLTLLQ